MWRATMPYYAYANYGRVDRSTRRHHAHTLGADAQVSVGTLLDWNQLANMWGSRR